MPIPTTYYSACAPAPFPPFPPPPPPSLACCLLNASRHARCWLHTGTLCTSIPPSSCSLGESAAAGILSFSQSGRLAICTRQYWPGPCSAGSAPFCHREITISQQWFFQWSAGAAPHQGLAAFFAPTHHRKASSAATNVDDVTQGLSHTDRAQHPTLKHCRRGGCCSESLVAA